MFKLNMNRRPKSITILSLVFIIVGVGGVVAAGSSIAMAWGNYVTSHEIMDNGLRIFSALIALTSGVFMLRGASWARWLCILWLTLHVVLSFLHTKFELIVHALLLATGIYILFRSAARKYFSSA